MKPLAVSMVYARNHLADVVSRVVFGGERVLLVRWHKAVAAVVSIDDLKRLQEWDIAEEKK